MTSRDGGPTTVGVAPCDATLEATYEAHTQRLFSSHSIHDRKPQKPDHALDRPNSRQKHGVGAGVSNNYYERTTVSI